MTNGVAIVTTNKLLLTTTNKLFITAAYKYVALAVMLTNCNLFVQQTHLPLDHPITRTNAILSRCSVNLPRLMEFGGSIVTEKYFFGFGHGHMANFWQWEFHAESIKNIRAQQVEWSKMSSQIGTNDVRQLALNWLMNLGVDVTAMGKKYPREIKQEFFYKNSGGDLEPLDKSKVPLPIFEISWGSIPLRGHPEYSHPAASMTIFGPTKELIEYHLFDDSLMLLPKLAVKDPETLLSITNAEFNKFDEIQRGNLVKKFAP
ncbi:MAG TPA: hypothetical protein VGH42_05420 [Verrucomicrobiae bacterium]